MNKKNKITRLSYELNYFGKDFVIEKKRKKKT